MKKHRGPGRFGRWAVTFLIILVLFMLLIPMNQEMNGIFGKYTAWIVAFLLILVVLSLLIPVHGSRTGVFGKYTPFAVAFLIVYLLLMMLIRCKPVHRHDRSYPLGYTHPYRNLYQPMSARQVRMYI